MSDMPTEIQPARGQVPATFSTGFQGVVDTWVLHYVTGSVNEGGESIQVHAKRDIERVARELAGPEPSASVVMLAQTAALCWASLRIAEAQLLGANGVTLAQGEYLQRQVERASNRWLRTLRTLAEVRRLESQVPTVQVNVANLVKVGGVRE